MIDNYRNLFMIFFVIGMTHFLYPAQKIISNDNTSSFLAKVQKNKTLLSFGLLTVAGLISPSLVQYFRIEIPHQKILSYAFPLSLASLFALSSKNELDKKDSSLKKYIVPILSLGISGAILYVKNNQPYGFCAENAYELMSAQAIVLYFINDIFLKNKIQVSKKIQKPLEGPFKDKDKQKEEEKINLEVDQRELDQSNLGQEKKTSVTIKPLIKEEMRELIETKREEKSKLAVKNQLDKPVIEGEQIIDEKERKLLLEEVSKLEENYSKLEKNNILHRLELKNIKNNIEKVQSEAKLTKLKKDFEDLKKAIEEEVSQINLKNTQLIENFKKNLNYLLKTIINLTQYLKDTILLMQSEKEEFFKQLGYESKMLTQHRDFLVIEDDISKDIFAYNVTLQKILDTVKVDLLNTFKNNVSSLETNIIIKSVKEFNSKIKNHINSEYVQRVKGSLDEAMGIIDLLRDFNEQSLKTEKTPKDFLTKLERISLLFKLPNLNEQPKKKNHQATVALKIEKKEKKEAGDDFSEEDKTLIQSCCKDMGIQEVFNIYQKVFILINMILLPDNSISMILEVEQVDEISNMNDLCKKINNFLRNYNPKQVENKEQIMIIINNIQKNKTRSDIFENLE